MLGHQFLLPPTPPRGDMTSLNHLSIIVHQKREDALVLAFTTAELKRYIAFAKTLKPKLTSDARKLLVDSYVALRRGDTALGSRVAYRMTVRQLEALIRLSEAIARSHLETQCGVWPD
nr:dna replication licensing factor mcm6 [Quercus suber]